MPDAGMCAAAGQLHVCLCAENCFPTTPSIPVFQPPPPPPSLLPPALWCRDLLRAYAKLQQFKVRPLAKATCYTGDRLLEQFATPHSRDGKAVARAYPWLTGYDAGAVGGERCLSFGGVRGGRTAG